VANSTYDIVTVGGGLGGSALAKAMAEHGARVLVLEREMQFKDRIRGEVMVSWGVAETQKLGIYQLLQETCAHELRWWNLYLGGVQTLQRDLLSTTPQQLAYLAFYHPAMQEVMLQAAADAGAEVRRGAVVREVKPGKSPSVIVEENGRVEEVQARLVVGADGRTSHMRKWGGFTVHQDPERLLIAGLLFEEMTKPPEDANTIVLNPTIGQTAYLFPQGHGRVRAYIVYHKAVLRRLQGAGDIPRFIEESVKAGAAPEWYAGARPVDPLATLEGAETWVPHPYKDGVVLIGDAASSSDPTWGQGLSLTLRDVRVLRDQLLTQQDWEAAGHAYAQEHDRYYGVIHLADNWWTELFLAVGPEAEARRAKALPLIAQDSTRAPDHIVSGPELPADETVRRRFFGEE
jgi:menaquinone-9 beta-reductase